MPIVFKVNSEKNFGHIDFWRLISLKNLLKYKSKVEKKVYFLSFIAHIALKQKSDIDTQVSSMFYYHVFSTYSLSLENLLCFYWRRTKYSRGQSPSDHN